MDLRIQDWVTNLLGFQSVTQFGAQQVQLQNHESPVECSTLLAPVPRGYESTSLVLVRDNLAVVPVDWDNDGIKTPWLSIQSHESLIDCTNKIKETSFVALDDDFLNVVGPGATLEKIHEFSGSDAQHVHEAPVYLPALHELLFADTSVVGWLWAIDVNKYTIRKINTNPPLENVNGATMRDSRIYVATNGGRAPAIWNCSVPTGAPKIKAGDSSENVQSGLEPERETINCIPLVNNYRLNHLNSPNDLIFTSSGNILFTDPTYGWAQSWPGVGPPELATATYHFNTKTRALITLDNDLVLQPNGLALSLDEKTLYIADSNSTSGKPIGVWHHSVRNVYAFDFDEASLTLKNRRLVHVAEAGWPDGIRVTKFKKNGVEKELVLAAIMGGVDVVDVSRGGAGTLLGKFNVGDDVIFNLEPVPEPGSKKGRAATTWLLTGKQGIYKVKIASVS